MHFVYIKLNIAAQIKSAVSNKKNKEHFKSEICSIFEYGHFSLRE